MAAYLTVNRPRVSQWYEKRNRPLTGCTVLHTSESVMDTVGPDTGTDTLARYIQGRTTAGSYHDVADSDSDLQLIEYRHGAFHDGTGSNNWALSISFVCRTVDWAMMSPERRRGFLRSGARAFARQQAYRRSVGAPLTELRRITKAQSDAGVSGFCYHGDRDPGRRTDPGVRPPAAFPMDEFIAECRAALAGTSTGEDEMNAAQEAKLDGLINHINWNLTPALARMDPAITVMFTEIGAIRASQMKLAEALAAADSNGLTLDELKAAVSEAIVDSGAALRKIEQAAAEAPVATPAA